MVAPQTQSSGPASRHIPSDVPPAARCRGSERCAHRNPITRDRCGRGRELLALRHTASGTRLWPSCVKEVATRRADQAPAPSVPLSTRPVPQPGARIRYHCLPPGAANAEPQAQRHRSPEPRTQTTLAGYWPSCQLVTALDACGACTPHVTDPARGCCRGRLSCMVIMSHLRIRFCGALCTRAHLRLARRFALQESAKNASQPRTFERSFPKKR